MKKPKQKDDLDKFLDKKSTRKAIIYGLIIAVVIVCVDSFRLVIKYLVRLYYGGNYNTTIEFLAEGIGLAIALGVLFILIYVSLKILKKSK